MFGQLHPFGRTPGRSKPVDVGIDSQGKLHHRDEGLLVALDAEILQFKVAVSIVARIVVEGKVIGTNRHTGTIEIGPLSRLVEFGKDVAERLFG